MSRQDQTSLNRFRFNILLALSPTLKSLANSIEATLFGGVVGKGVEAVPFVLVLVSSLADDLKGRSLGLFEATHSSCREFHCM